MLPETSQAQGRKRVRHRGRARADAWACGVKGFASAVLGSTCHHGPALSAKETASVGAAPAPVVRLPGRVMKAPWLGPVQCVRGRVAGWVFLNYSRRGARRS